MTRAEEDGCMTSLLQLACCETMVKIEIGYVACRLIR